MNFLQLVQRFHSEASMAGAAPTTVVSQMGEAGRAVDWVNSAYEDIQMMHPDWNFLLEDFSFPTVAGTQLYTKAATGLTSLSAYITDDIRVYLTHTDEDELIYIPWRDFKKECMFGDSRDQSNRPYMCSVDPDSSLALWPTPDAIYTVSGQYQKEVQSLSANTDIPIIPVQFHMIIVWRALMFYGAFENAGEVYAHGQNEFNRILARLEINQLPKIEWGAPLA